MVAWKDQPQGPQQSTEAMEVVALEATMYLRKHFSDLTVKGKCMS